MNRSSRDDIGLKMAAKIPSLYTIAKRVIESLDRIPTVHCTSCKNRTIAIARCFSCEHFLCQNCKMEHRFMHCVRGHRVITLPMECQYDVNENKNRLTNDNAGLCVCQTEKARKYFCRTCKVLVCKECFLMDYPGGIHDWELLFDVTFKRLEHVNRATEEGKNDVTYIGKMIKNLERSFSRIRVQYSEAQSEINGTLRFYRSALEDRKQELLNELESVFSLECELASSMFLPKSQLERKEIMYHCKFGGEFGDLEGQFSEPSGVAVNAQNDIIVADTGNHRIQIFNKEGRFKFQFKDSQVLRPNRVAVVKKSGDIVVIERSPTPQLYIYKQYGKLMRKFGVNLIQDPRGVAVDNIGRIIVLEGKVQRVIMFDQAGTVLQKFRCTKHLVCPNDVEVNDKQEIFISDYSASCVKVFNYDGVFLRQIGGEGVTDNPIGVCINSVGEILVVNNNKNFQLTIFTQEGQLVSALQSKVKHTDCYDVALMNDGSVLLASKNYNFYIYRYLHLLPL